MVLDEGRNNVLVVLRNVLGNIKYFFLLLDFCHICTTIKNKIGKALYIKNNSISRLKLNIFIVIRHKVYEKNSTQELG